MLNFSIDENIVANNFLIPLVILSVLSNLVIYRGNNNDLRSILFLDSFSIIILNYFFNPILAFTIYFCFLHSIRHSLSLISEINKNLMKGFPIFLRKIIPLTVITAIMYLIVFYFISEKFGIDESIIKIIFVGLASLTFPHILLEFMVEKKMKNKTINLIGWILFIISSIGFIISSVGSFWAMFGSLFFFIACIVFLIPFFKKDENE